MPDSSEKANSDSDKGRYELNRGKGKHAYFSVLTPPSVEQVAEYNRPVRFSSLDIALKANEATSATYEVTASDSSIRSIPIVYSYNNPRDLLIFAKVTDQTYRNDELRGKLNAHLVELLQDAEKFTGNKVRIKGIAVVDSQGSFGMTTGPAGIHIDQADLKTLANAIQSGDAEKIKAAKAHIGSSFAHEMVHLSRDETASFVQNRMEIPTHVVQYLYDPHNNVQFKANLASFFDNNVKDNTLSQMREQNNHYPRETYMAALIVADELSKVRPEFKEAWEADKSPNKRDSILRMSDYIHGDMQKKLNAELVPQIMNGEAGKISLEALEARAEKVYSAQDMHTGKGYVPLPDSKTPIDLIRKALNATEPAVPEAKLREDFSRSYHEALKHAPPELKKIIETAGSVTKAHFVEVYNNTLRDVDGSYSKAESKQAELKTSFTELLEATKDPKKFNETRLTEFEKRASELARVKAPAYDTSAGNGGDPAYNRWSSAAMNKVGLVGGLKSLSQGEGDYFQVMGAQALATSSAGLAADLAHAPVTSRILGKISMPFSPFIDVPLAYQYAKQGNLVGAGLHSANAVTGVAASAEAFAAKTVERSVMTRGLSKAFVPVAIAAEAYHIAETLEQIDNLEQVIKHLNTTIEQQNEILSKPGLNYSFKARLEKAADVAEYIKSHENSTSEKYAELTELAYAYAPKEEQFKQLAQAKREVGTLLNKQWNESTSIPEREQDITKAKTALAKQKEALIDEYYTHPAVDSWRRPFPKASRETLSDANTRRRHHQQIAREEGSLTDFSVSGFNFADDKQLRNLQGHLEKIDTIDQRINALTGASIELGTEKSEQFPEELTFKARREQAEQLDQTLSPKLDSLRRDTPQLEAIMKPYQEEHEQLVAQYTKTFSITPKPLPAYQKVETEFNTLQAAHKKYPDNKQLERMALTSKIEMLSLQPENHAHIHTGIMADVAAHTHNYHNMISEPAFQQQLAQIDISTLPPALQEQHAQYQAAMAAHHKSKAKVDTARADMVERFGDAGQQTALLQSGNQEIRDALKDLRATEQHSLIDYIKAVGQEERYIEELQDIARKQYQEQIYASEPIIMRQIKQQPRYNNLVYKPNPRESNIMLSYSATESQHTHLIVELKKAGIDLSSGREGELNVEAPHLSAEERVTERLALLASRTDAAPIQETQKQFYIDLTPAQAAYLKEKSQNGVVTLPSGKEIQLGQTASTTVMQQNNNPTHSLHDQLEGLNCQGIIYTESDSQWKQPLSTPSQNGGMDKITYR